MHKQGKRRIAGGDRGVIDFIEHALADARTVGDGDGRRFTWGVGVGVLPGLDLCALQPGSD